jgi:hypothetical protein
VDRCGPPLITDLILADLVKLEKDAKFPLPRLNSELYFIKKSIIRDDKLIASFWVKLTSEVSAVFSADASPLQKSRALKELESYLDGRLKEVGLEDTHLFVRGDDHFCHLARKHMKFEDVVGIPLFRSYGG